MASMRLKLEDIIEAREKLEAIGLVKVYYKEGNINNYIYELYSPLSPDEFINNPILSTALESNIGKREYNKTVKFFITPKIDLTGYEDITSKFNDVFDSISLGDVNEYKDVRRVKSIDIMIDEKVDLNSIISSIPSEMLNHRSVTKNNRSLIYKLSFVYNLGEDELTELIRNSLNEKHRIDQDKLRENCRNYYTFEHSNSSPSLVYKKQPDYLRKTVTDTSKRSRQIYTFETTTPYEFLTGKNKGLKPSKTDLNLIEALIVDYDLSYGVVNVLIDYVLRINNNKLTKNFVTAIATQWKRSNIKTVEEAMDFCKKENKKLKPVKKEKKPDWYNKELEEDIASDEDIKSLEDKLKRI